MFKGLATAALGAALIVGSGAGGAYAAIKSEKVTYKVGDRELTGYLAYDDARSGKRPGIIVVHEWWGHDAYARRRAEMLAAEGYTALALDMYGTGRLAAHPKDAKTFAVEVIKTKGAMHARFRAAYDLLKGHKTVDASKTAAIGYCFGGNVILDMARAGVELDGVVGFHASLTQTIKAKPGAIKAKIRIFNGADDPFIKPAKLSALKSEMKALGADFEYTAYPGVVHSFTSPAATARGQKLKLPLRYDVRADHDSWGQTLVFFQRIFK